ncbi:MAG: hypothetical protein KatS3mg060_3571 [Dehalococcoidia bacterium]|nr:MAG: hypothetical protein KatS3mg060_3571 [Dehalococcoidia bacterium]
MDERLAIWDAHTHIFPPEIVTARETVDDPYFRALYATPRSRLADGPALLRLLDEAGVARAVIAGWGWGDLRRCQQGNDYLLDQAARCPARFIPFVTAPPRAGDAALREIERAAAGGARGVGELMPDGQDVAPDDQALDPIIELATDLGLVVLIHASEPVGHRYPGKGTSSTSNA